MIRAITVSRASLKPLSTIATRFLHQQTTPPHSTPPFSTQTAAAIAIASLGLVTAGTFITNNTTTQNPPISIHQNNYNNISIAFYTSIIATCDGDNFFSRDEVSKHTTLETGIWVTFKDGVYDITEFIEQHPGGAKRILMAAGGRVDPFWNLYQQHFTEKVQDQLKALRIGTLNPDEPQIIDDTDPYKDEPGKYSKRRRSNVAVIIVRIVLN
jgi:hypothetical protein